MVKESILWSSRLQNHEHSLALYMFSCFYKVAQKWYDDAKKMKSKVCRLAKRFKFSQLICVLVANLSNCLVNML